MPDSLKRRVNYEFGFLIDVYMLCYVMLCYFMICINILKESSTTIDYRLYELLVNGEFQMTKFHQIYHPGIVDTI